MEELKCRLCSTSIALVSLFTGKCKSRDYIRKLIESIIGIKIEKNDFFRRICLTCMFQIYNFYIFRTRCLQNEEKLQTLVKDVEKVIHNYKTPIMDLDNIELPDIDKLRNIVKPWLLSKQECLRTKNKEYGNIQQNSAGTGKNQFETTECGSQFEPICMVDKNVQCMLPVADCNYNTNKLFNATSTIECSSQFEPINIADESIQCQLTEKKDSRSINIQCDILKVLPKKKYREIGIQGELLKELSHIETAKSPPDYKLMEARINPLDTSLESHCANIFSAEPSDLLTVQDKVQYVKICRQCGCTEYSKSKYKLHKQTHKICSLCKKKFRSIKETKIHMQTECALTSTSLIIKIARMETLKEFQIKYPEAVKKLNECKKNTQPVGNLTNKVFMDEGKLFEKIPNLCDSELPNKRGEKRKKDVDGMDSDE